MLDLAYLQEIEKHQGLYAGRQSQNRAALMQCDKGHLNDIHHEQSFLETMHYQNKAVTLKLLAVVLHYNQLFCGNGNYHRALEWKLFL